jgi:hypothetical protein
MRRWTNLALLVLAVSAFFSGWLAFAFATAASRWSLIAHIVSGYGIVALTPWKYLIASNGLRRRASGWWGSLVFTGLIVVSIVAGILHSTGLLRSAGDFSAMEVHVGAAIAALPFGVWHVLARRVPARAVDFSRRSLLRAGRLLASAGVTYAAGEALVRIAGLPGAGRRFTGSYEVASFQPLSMPVTQWMFDAVPRVDIAGWRLQVWSGAQLREWTYEELAAFNDQVTATLDCTGGFFTTQHWTGVWLSRLVEPAGALSVRVLSQTGYDRRFPVEDLPRILLATRVGDSPLSAGNGYPVRVVAADRRGFWWVKWVSRIDAEGIPAFWQAPFPLQ